MESNFISINERKKPYSNNGPNQNQANSGNEIENKLTGGRNR